MNGVGGLQCGKGQANEETGGKAGWTLTAMAPLPGGSPSRNLLSTSVWVPVKLGVRAPDITVAETLVSLQLFLSSAFILACPRHSAIVISESAYKTRNGHGAQLAVTPLYPPAV